MCAGGLVLPPTTSDETSVGAVALPIVTYIASEFDVYADNNTATVSAIDIQQTASLQSLERLLFNEVPALQSSHNAPFSTSAI